MKFIFYNCKYNVLSGSFKDYQELVPGVEKSVFIVGNTVDFDENQAYNILNYKKVRFYLIPISFKDNFFNCIERFKQNKSSSRGTWEDDKSDFKDGQEKGLKEFICSNISEKENPTTDSIIFSEILEIRENLDKTNDDKKQPDDDIPTDNKKTIFDRITDKINIIIVIICIIVVLIGLIVFKLISNDGIQMIKIEAQKALADGRYDDAKRLADQVDESYAKKINIAIEENKRARVHSEPEPEPEPKLVPKPVVSPIYNMLKILQQNSEIAFKTRRWTTPAHNNVVWWASQMLQMEPENTFAKDMLENVIKKYLQLHRNKKLTIEQLEQKINTPVLPKTRLKDYANTNQDWRIRQLLEQN